VQWRLIPIVSIYVWPFPKVAIWQDLSTAKMMLYGPYEDGDAKRVDTRDRSIRLIQRVIRGGIARQRARRLQFDHTGEALRPPTPNKARSRWAKALKKVTAQVQVALAFKQGGKERRVRLGGGSSDGGEYAVSQTYSQPLMRRQQDDVGDLLSLYLPYTTEVGDVPVGKKGMPTTKNVPFARGRARQKTTAILNWAIERLKLTNQKSCQPYVCAVRGGGARLGVSSVARELPVVILPWYGYCVPIVL
jgi:hypothetical protein